MFASGPCRRHIATHFIEQPRYPGRCQDRRLCVPALLLVYLWSDEVFRPHGDTVGVMVS